MRFHRHAQELLFEEDNEKRILFEHTIDRIVDKSLKGINQENGIRVISNLLPEFHDESKSRSALTIMRNFPAPLTPKFMTVEEYFNILRWGNSPSIQDQKKKILYSILMELDESTSTSDFETMFDNFDVISQNNLLSGFQVMLKSKVSKSGETDHIFAEWLVSRINHYEESLDLLNQLISPCIIPYMGSRVIGDFQNATIINIDSDEQGKLYGQSFVCLREHINDSKIGLVYIAEMEAIINGKNEIVDTQFCIQEFNYLSSYIQREKINQIINEVITRLANLESNKETVHNYSEHIQKTINLFSQLVMILRRNIDVPFTDEVVEILKSFSAKIILDQSVRDQYLEFMDLFISEFQNDNNSLLLTGLSEGFNNCYEDLETSKSFLKLILNKEKYITVSVSKPIISKIDLTMQQNDSNVFNNTYEYLCILVENSSFINEIISYSKHWITLTQNFPEKALREKVEILSLLHNKKLIKTEDLVSCYFENLPFSENSENSRIVIEELDKFQSFISDEMGYQFFTKVISNFDQFGPSNILALSFVGKWLQFSSVDERLLFHQLIINNFSSGPMSCMRTVATYANQLEHIRLQEQLIQFFIADFSQQDFILCRNEATNAILKVINKDFLSTLCFEIWEIILHIPNKSEEFMNIAQNYLPIKDILIMRGQKIDSIKSNREPQNITKGLRFLATTTRKDLHSIKPVFEVFFVLFNGSSFEEYNLALSYCGPCLKMIINDKYRHSLAELIGRNYWRIADGQIAIEKIYEVTNYLELKNFSLEYWRP